MSKSMEYDTVLPSVLWHCWLGNRKGIRSVESWVLVCWWWWFDWSFARLIAPFFTTTAIINAAMKTRMVAFWYRFIRVVLFWKMAIKRVLMWLYYWQLLDKRCVSNAGQQSTGNVIGTRHTADASWAARSLPSSSGVSRPHWPAPACAHRGRKTGTSSALAGKSWPRRQRTW